MTTTDTTDFATWLPATARGLGYMKDADLARAIDAPQSTITRWRQGGRPSVQHLVRLSKVFGMPVLPLLALAGHVDPDEIGRPEMPEPPTPVSEAERRIIDSDLEEEQKQLFLRYWNMRLHEERERLHELIRIDLKEGGDDESTSREHLAELLKSDLAKHVLWLAEANADVLDDKASKIEHEVHRLERQLARARRRQAKKVNT